MLEILDKLFGEQLKLTAEYWLIVLVCVVAVAFLVTLIVGLVVGRFKKIKAVMRMATANPSATVAAMKKMPQAVKTQYKDARMGNLKPSMLVTQQVCVDEPYRYSLLSKVWIVTFVATLICAMLAFVISPVAVQPSLGEGATEEEIAAFEKTMEAIRIAPYTSAAFVLIAGGLLTLVGAIVGHCMYNSAVKAYEKFAPVMDGDPRAAEQMSASAENQQVYAEPQQQYAEQPQQYAEQPMYGEPQQAYAEPQQVYAEPQPVYGEPQQAYAEPQQVYAEPQTVVAAEPQESDEEIRRRAREEALARAREQQAAQQQAAQPQPQVVQQQQAKPQQQAAPAGSSSVDDVIAQIEKIDRDGAPRETMREVAQLLQRERNKPENKTPEQQRRLNEALSKLLKAMSAASRK